MTALGAIRFDILIDYWPLFVKGTVNTIKFSLISVSLGTLLGLFLCFLRLSKLSILNYLNIVYINIFRGTPALVQILVLHFAVLPSIGKFPAAASGIIALSLNSSAYISEIFRAGIISIERGQMEAARSLGMTYIQAMRYIIVPQALQRVIPPLGNVFISMLKDSSLVSTIAIQELTFAGSLISETTLRVWEAWIMVAGLYLAMTLLLTRGVHQVEKKMTKGN